MYRAEFFTIDALDHLPRALDVLRKMGFRLLDLQMKAVAGGARVHLVLEGASAQSAVIFAERVSVLRGVERFSMREMAPAL
jgi:acetolactate synthase regulatory subunit